LKRTPLAKPRGQVVGAKSKLTDGGIDLSSGDFLVLANGKK
jgi:hypothetical protein